MDQSADAAAFPDADGRVAALMGLNGCSTQPAPREKIMPYVRQPEAMVPGKALYFATAMPLAGVATGVLVESHEGRPTKIEGNPSHPASLGSSDLLMQASILGLYDPDRSQAVTYRGRPRPGTSACRLSAGQLEKLKIHGGEGLCILTENVDVADLGRADEGAARRGSFPESQVVSIRAGRPLERAGRRKAGFR